MDTTVKNRPRLSVEQAENEIFALARKHGVVYQETPLDRRGNAITRLAGDDVELDEPAKLLLALSRAGHITNAQATQMHGRYLRAKHE